MAQLDCIRRLPEGRRKVRGYRLAGRVLARVGEAMGAPWEGKNS